MAAGKKILGRRLAEIREGQLQTQQEWADALGWSLSNLRRLESAEVVGISLDGLRDLAKFLKKTPHDLLADLETTAPAAANGHGVKLPKRASRRLPLYPAVSAVSADLRPDKSDGMVDWSGPDGDFAVILDGACMEPRYRDGEKAICSIARWRDEGFVDGQDYWVKFDTDETTFKRVERDPRDHEVIWFIPLNENGEHKRWKKHRKHVALAARAVGRLD